MATAIELGFDKSDTMRMENYNVINEYKKKIEDATAKIISNECYIEFSCNVSI